MVLMTRSYFYFCIECGRNFETVSAEQAACTDECAAVHAARIRDVVQAEVRRMDLEDKLVDLEKVIKRNPTIPKYDFLS